MTENLLKALAVIITVCAAIPVTSAVLRRRQLQRLRSGRNAKIALDAFIQHLSNFDRARVEAVDREIQGLVASNFPIMPEDRLLEDLDVDQGELDAFIEDRAIVPSSKDATRGPTSAELAMAMIRKDQSQ